MLARSAPSTSPDAVARAVEQLRLGWRLYLVEDPPQVLFLSKVPRAVLQAVFYVLLARVTGGEQESGQSAFVGISAYLMCLSSIIAAASSPALDRDEGTLYRVLTGAVPPFRFFVLKYLPYTGEAMLVSLAVLAVAGPVLGIGGTSVDLLANLGLYVLMAVTSTCLGIAVGVLAIMGRSEFLLGNASSYLVLVLSGAVVPADRLGALGHLGTVLPLTHGIEALRLSLAGQPYAGAVAAEIAVGLGWLALAWSLAVRWGRRARVHDLT
ncbi:ABC transporter permease [Kitasatospora sp. NBC_00240]|uniref:ABC transporter permease n=1 Tax=Kitasatospora sp. NBC_00240 TaxID=2903567 RepID=UPI00224CFD49|nr:ABC transporter permease [Kitasatospora sp. NBC_00240]MCX5210103.1 ABC transporter permease [Kitasatospora sp. NBC_00240]